MEITKHNSFFTIFPFNDGYDSFIERRCLYVLFPKLHSSCETMGSKIYGENLKPDTCIPPT